jgi:hypothetical protein
MYAIWYFNDNIYKLLLLLLWICMMVGSKLCKFKSIVFILYKNIYTYFQYKILQLNIMFF